MTRTTNDPIPSSPLEQFVRDYVEARGGVWDEIEPQVYDLLIGPEITEVAFDPEALPEHPQAQLASLGSPLMDRLLADATERWSSARLYRVGLNLHPRDLESRVRRAVSLPQGAGLRVDRVRRMNFPQAIFWFKATFAGDQKEEELLPIGIDLHHRREVRHLDALLGEGRLSEEAQARLPEAPHASLAAGYRAARDHVVRTVAALANARRREWSARVEKQIARMVSYYAQLRQEAEEQAARARGRDTEAPGVEGAEGVAGDDTASKAAARAAGRQESIDREERLRVAELRQKSAVRVQVKLAGLMVIHQPKLLVGATVTAKEKPVGGLEIVWDTLTESVEAVPCPRCGHPTFEFRLDRKGLGCPNCEGVRG
jgi:hypothetical protein